MGPIPVLGSPRTSRMSPAASTARVSPGAELCTPGGAELFTGAVMRQSRNHLGSSGSGSMPLAGFPCIHPTQTRSKGHHKPPGCGGSVGIEAHFPHFQSEKGNSWCPTHAPDTTRAVPHAHFHTRNLQNNAQPGETEARRGREFHPAAELE